MDVHISSKGAFGPNVDRQVSAPGTTQGALTWPSGYGPKAIRVRLKGGSSGDQIKMCFDAPSSAIATAWLADVGSASTDRMHRVLDDVGWTEFWFTEPLENLYFVGVGTLGAGTVFEVEAN